VSNGLFRKKALEKLSSPEQLDKLIVITSPKGWLALLAVGLIMTVGLLWGIFGTIYYKTVGWGFLVKSGGIYTVQSPSDGRLRSIDVEPGDLVRSGQVIGRIEQEGLVIQLRNTWDRLMHLQAQFKMIENLNTEDIKNKMKYLSEEELNIKKEIRDLKEHENWLEKMLKRYEELRREGIMSEVQYHKNKRDLEDLRIRITGETNKLKNIRYQKSKEKSIVRKEHLLKEIQIKDEEKKLKQLYKVLIKSSEVVSKHSGRVLERMVKDGEVVYKSNPIISMVEEEGKVLQANLYFDAANGKKIRPGMRANVTPTVVKSEKFGSIVGIVTEVGKRPSSKKAIMARLQNQSLVEMVTSLGAPFMATIKLIPDPETVSGFKWTSSRGPAIAIGSGTACSGSVTTRKEAPINLLLQLSKKYLLGIGETEGKVEKMIETGGKSESNQK